MKSNLLAEYKFNKTRPILAHKDSYLAFKEKIESNINASALPGNTILLTPDVPYENIFGVAVLDFSGFMVNTASAIDEQFYGVISLQNFCQKFQLAGLDDEVKSIIIDFDSGGGYVSYMEETAALIAEISADKPVYAYTSGLLCSAAYFCAVNCTQIFASPSARVGNIGTYSEYLTLNGESTTKDGITKSVFPDAGYTVTTFQSGEDKTIGSEFIPLTPEQEEQIQSDIDYLGNSFRQTVNTMRGGVKPEFMTGLAYTGKQAMDTNSNLIDGTINSLALLVKKVIETNK